MSEDLRQLVYRMVQERGLEKLWPLIDYIVTNESGWQNIQSTYPDPSGPNGQENSWGPFQLLIESNGQPGLGDGFTSEQLLDPELNAEIALDYILDQLNAGVPLQQAVQPWSVTHNIDALAVATGAQPPPAGQAVRAAGEDETRVPSPGEWVEQNGMMPADYAASWRFAPGPGEAGDEWLGQQTTEYRKWVMGQYDAEFGLGDTALTAAEQEQERLELAGEELDLGLWPYSIDQETFDTERQWYLDQVAAGKYKATEAISRFNAWLNAQQEVGRRAETLLEREEQILPTSEFPLTEKGGMLANIAERRGMPWTPWEGVPVEEMTSPEAAFSHFQQEMGVSPQAPELVSYDPAPVMEQYGQAVGAQSQGAQAAAQWIREMLQKRGIPSM